MPSTTLLCTDCDAEKSRKEAAGCTNVTCSPIAAQPGFCTLNWTLPQPAAKANKAKPSKKKTS